MKLYTSCFRCRTELVLDDQPRFDPHCLNCPPSDLEEAEIEYVVAVLAEHASAAAALAAALGDRLNDLHLATQTVSARVAAKAYAGHGWPVFPVAPGSKVPAIPKSQGGKGVLDATTDIDRIDEYWQKNPKANVGVATGVMFDVIDIDWKVPGAASAWADIREQEDLEVHAMVSTPGGLHVYVMPTGDGNTTNPDIGVDYRGKGGYVVVPPSTRPEGTYRWISKPSPRILKP